MGWLALRFEADVLTADALADALMEAGALSVSFDDADAGTPDEAAQFAEPGLRAPGAWPRNALTVLIEQDADPGCLLANAASVCSIQVPEFSVTRVEDQDWVRTTQSQFKPIRVDDALWIVPSWCTPPDKRATNISIDPGLAFGTGSHATTRLVLRWLARNLDAGDSVLDYGCGSGILAIVAARLGAGRVFGVDIDPQSILAAAANAEKNSVDIRFHLPDEAPEEASQIVVANILANPLIVLAPLIAAKCSKRIALSGILEEQAQEVVEAYAPWFNARVAEREDGWVLLEGERIPGRA